jgi:gamma-glutamyltranspeptidase/glutathione hydrolase
MILDKARLQRAAGSVDRGGTGIWPTGMDAPHSTAYLCATDEDGMAVSIIQSNYRGTGSPYGAARSGFLLQDRGLGFTLTPGHPNELAPGKRPLHTLAPTLWTEADRPRWILGTRGGAVQPQIIAQMAARAILGSQGLEEAQRAPRWTMSEFGPSSRSALSMEPGVSSSVIDHLRSLGHQIEVLEGPQPGWGPVSIIEVDGETRRAAADPRVDTTEALVF